MFLFCRERCNHGQETVPVSVPDKNYNLGQEYTPEREYSNHGREYSSNPGQEAIFYNHGQEAIPIPNSNNGR